MSKVDCVSLNKTDIQIWLPPQASSEKKGQFGMDKFPLSLVCYGNNMSQQSHKNKVNVDFGNPNFVALATGTPLMLKPKKKRSNTRTKPTIYVPKRQSSLSNEEPVIRTTENDDLYLKFSKQLTDSLEIKAVKCQKFGKVLRVKNERSKKLRHLFKVNIQNSCTKKISSVAQNPTFSKQPTPSVKNIIPEDGTVIKNQQKPHKDNSNLNLQLAGTSALKKKKEKKSKKNAKQEAVEKNSFPKYWSSSDVQKGLQNGELLKGVLRINPKNYREAYVSNKDRTKQDYVIESLADRNRALEGDVVVLKLKPENEWKEKQQTAIVVYIYEMVHPRKAVGFLKPSPDKNKKFALFCPRDNRIPRIRIPSSDWPPLFSVDPDRYEDTLFLAKITEWKEVNFARGSILENIGTSFDIKSETKALLLENELDVSHFPPEALEHVPKAKEIDEEEFEYRIDLREDCTFTIDPLTARDLDDAVSCKELPNGNLEVGVHISDVSYFLEEDTILDKLVRQKATSIYLVDDVFHMLPTEMCLHCSLLPGKDKLAFSVIWEMTREGKILSTRFARTVINSCAQLAYEHAQQIIENPDKVISKSKLPEIHNGFKPRDLQNIVLNLYKISLNLRGKRFENGALQINQPKIIFRLDSNNVPTEWLVYENKEAHRLIEEFMLLANISVAERIRNCFPDLAFLRCHDPPAHHMLFDVQKTMEAAGINIDISSAAAIQTSLRKYASSDYFGITRMAVLNHLLAKPMTRARYFCAADCQNEADYFHYALSIPLYTHFTSPIRRYADIMVHRLLAASLGYTEVPAWKTEKVVEIAANCNKQKYNAKRAGEASIDLFFAYYVETHQPFIQDAVVCDVKDHSFDVVVVATGTSVRVYADKLEEGVKWSFMQEESFKKVVIEFPETSEQESATCIIQLFTVVKVALQRKAKTNKLEANLLRPIQGLIFDRSY